MTLGIYGAGGLGREVLELAIVIEEQKNRWDEIIFIDDKPDLHCVRSHRVLPFETFLLEFEPESAEIVIAVGEPFIRKKIRETVIEKGYSLAVLVHPSAQIAGDCILMEGAVVHHNSLVSSGVTVGSNAYLQPSCVIGHDTRIGEDCVISTFDVIAGSCVVGDQTYVGLSSCIKEQTQIGKGAIIGMGSALMKDVPDLGVTMGNPAKIIRYNDNHKVFG